MLYEELIKNVNVFSMCRDDTTSVSKEILDKLSSELFKQTFPLKSSITNKIKSINNNYYSITKKVKLVEVIGVNKETDTLIIRIVFVGEPKLFSGIIICQEDKFGTNVVGTYFPEKLEYSQSLVVEVHMLNKFLLSI